ncbi:G-type lectin S-receptor-like serine/threonine-protein kinase At4g03230 [Pistacia vera]|uniref:G-type lectin S-receptor-like serine/threonine-protein kinase At4g03230 n=1 Tax=Pistacia vera TaxID=55513 RepID=UPI001262FCB6|nr:G-type lectin S-receptor-like serine/threonine-protein kinase At4g03230 [Pistacia vera]
MRSTPNQNHLPSTICVLYTLLSCSLLLYCSARDTISVNTSLKDGETLVSAGQRFELGFFTPPKSSDIRYVGIWYFKSKPRIVVWVANRESHLPDSNGSFVIANDGNLKVLDAAGIAYWNTNLKSSLPGVREAKLMDSGNLMTENISLRSWLSEDNPGEGNFSFKMVQGVNPYLILKGNITYWTSGKSGDFFRSYEIAYLLSNFSKSTLKSTDSKSLFYGLKNISNIDYSHTRLVMHFTGQIQFWKKDKMKDWSLMLSEPSDPCRVYSYCGNFGSCNSNNRVKCKCLPGFKAKSPEKWNSGDFSGGCTRKNPICAANDMVFGLKMMKLDNTDIRIPDARTESECQRACYNECQCQAYSFVKATLREDPVCWIWKQDLNDLQEEYANGGRDIYVRVAPSDIESTERNCKTCGTNLIPYPLSTEPSCGDPNYFSFVCDTSTGQVSFKALSGTYRIARIDPDTRNFSIQIKRVDARNSEGILKLNLSLPFYILTNGFDAGQEDSSYGNSSNSASEVVIYWTPPLEPTCSTQKDCINWPHSTCKLAGNRVRKCLCSETHRWDGLLLNCTSVNPDEGGHTLQNGRSDVRKKQWILTVGVIVASVIVLFIIVYFFCQRKKTQTQEDRESLQQNLAVRFNDSARHVKGLVDTDQFREEDKKGIDLPFFDFESILAATDNFSEANKLGKGGFGPVYKGKFPGGQEIAVKRLSSVSGQGLEEFKNEVVLIARLQHRNLVKLLGYCVEGGEKILLYEYMPNKSLDSFIFDPTCSVLLDWEMRFNIILGIARGILYLHQDSRLRIIHRDLKTSNVLLDQEMNPKISDFGLARIFEGKQTEGSTNRVVGTYGYMSPEYALDGYFSIKSDVFSFGVVVLEIVSGKKNTGFYNSEEALSLLGYAWRLWREDKALDIMDQKLSPSFNKIEVLKCINVGLLCVQEDPNDRPTMSNVVIMLGSETATLATPKQPAFIIRRGPSTSASSSSKPNINSELTVSLTGR